MSIVVLLACLRSCTYVTSSLNQVEAELYDHIILVAKYAGDLACNPSSGSLGLVSCTTKRTNYTPLHNLKIDLLHIHLLIELRRELS
jgi:hypothetical protein